MNERRHSSRFNVDLSARYRIMDAPEVIYRTTVVNVGGEGVCFVAFHPMKYDTEIELQINLHGREKIAIKTKVAWVKSIKDNKEFLIGVKIIDANQKDEKKFIKFYCHQILIAPKSEYKILIVDDERDMVNLLKKELEQKKYTVVCAHDGLDGYDKFLQEKPDLVLLDLMLPKLNGYALCRKIRRENKDLQTPIVMLSAKKEDEDRIIGRVIGVEKYITKPFDTEEVLEEIEMLLHQTY